MVESSMQPSNPPLDEQPAEPYIQSMPVSEDEEKPDTTEDQEMTNDEYYIEKLRKENLLRTVKEMNEKQIFLFEVFIDYIEITKENELLTCGESGLLPPLRVRVKFANIPCFDIFEEEITTPDQQDVTNLSGKVIGLSTNTQSDTCSQHGQWKSTYGKSCLFFMIPMELLYCIQSTPVWIDVYRTAEENYECPSSSVGHTKFLLEEDFIDCVLHAGNIKSELPTNAYQSRSCTIHNMAKEETGKLNVFIRLSCFGNMISTQFQMSKDGKEYMFKHSPGESQVGTTGIDLPEDYIPPKSLGKTDLLALHPLVASEEHLIGVCIYSDKDLLNRDSSNAVICKHSKTKASTGAFVEPDQCNYALRQQISPTINETDLVSRLSCNCYEISLPVLDEKKYSYNQVKTRKPFYCKRFEKLLSMYETKDNISSTDVDEDKCFCPDCTCNSTKKTKPFYCERYEKLLSNQKTKAESTASFSKKDSNPSFKKRLGSGDSEEVELKSQTKKRSVEKQMKDIHETDPTKVIEELWKSTVPLERGSVDQSNIKFNQRQSKPKKNKIFCGALKKPIKKKEQVIESNHKLSYRRPQFDYSRREYPGMKIGHKFCTEAASLVPENMGWLWNIEDKSLGLKIRKGWRPGAIGKSVTSQKNYIKKPQTSTVPDNVSSVPGMQRIRHGWARQRVNDKKESFSELVGQPPTFRLKQTCGKYYLSMIPIKEESEEEQKPVQIQVMPDEPDESVSNSAGTSDTSIEVVFTCPGALRRKVVKPAYTEANTQYLEEDTKVLLPKKSTSKPTTSKNKKEIKIVPPKAANSEPKNNLWEEQQTQMSLQKKKK